MLGCACGDAASSKPSLCWRLSATRAMQHAPAQHALCMQHASLIRQGNAHVVDSLLNYETVKYFDSTSPVDHSLAAAPTGEDVSYRYRPRITHGTLAALIGTTGSTLGRAAPERTARMLLWPDDTHESRKYEGVLREYELMGVKTQSSLALLNFGQSFIFTSSLTLMMILAANGIRAGRLRLTPAQCVSGAIYTSSTARPAPAVQAPWGS